MVAMQEIKMHSSVVIAMSQTLCLTSLAQTAHTRVRGIMTNSFIFSMLLLLLLPLIDSQDEMVY
jgi:hypothetical protein